VPARTVYACHLKAKLEVGIYLVSFMYPGPAGTHATHGSTPETIIAFMQPISRILQALFFISLILKASDSGVQVQSLKHDSRRLKLKLHPVAEDKLEATVS